MTALLATTDVAAQLAQASDESILKPLAFSLVVFLLAILLGFEVISKVPATLHTPLMSGSNAISGITIVGALVIAGTADLWWVQWIFGFLAMVFATINVVGGFVVTDRMLAMFKKR
ncbi:MAG: NAD(P) transhydrogenase subunit alpha [Planctomycetes bacterium]|nr:NAD(P) transhydrogenase subunit alpha [Planctomycetota bacterium]